MLLDKIHQHAYWRVVIRPTQFNPREITSLGTCERIVRSSQVVLRGWDYPWVEKIQVGQDWIESYCDSDIVSRYESWRFFLSGQFVHHFTVDEEFHGLNWTPSPDRYLSVLNCLYTVTEIFEFAARLAQHGILRPAAEVSIRLYGMQNRQLTHERLEQAMVFGGYFSRMDEIAHDVAIPASQLLGSTADLALDGATAIFERFGWLNPPRDQLTEEQRKLLERRLGV